MLSLTKEVFTWFIKFKKFSTGSITIMRSKSNFSKTAVEERKVLVDAVNINYARAGTGEHPVLLLPGVMGSIWTDFKPQIENLNKEKFTIIAWDPPGYGKSRPPEKTFPENFFRRDAIWAYNLMKTLGYDKFSLVGWSAGGVTSMILAARYPESVKKMVVVGSNSHFGPKNVEFLETMRNPDSWSEQMRAPLVALYGKEYFKKMCEDWIDGMKHIFEKNQGNMCDDDLPKINCPTLIVYGEKDPMVSLEHQYYLKDNIKNSRLEFFKDGSHNLHLRYANEFNALVEKFLVG